MLFFFFSYGFRSFNEILKLVPWWQLLVYDTHNLAKVCHGSKLLESKWPRGTNFFHDCVGFRFWNGTWSFLLMYTQRLTLINLTSDISKVLFCNTLVFLIKKKLLTFISIASQPTNTLQAAIETTRY